MREYKVNKKENIPEKMYGRRLKTMVNEPMTIRELKQSFFYYIVIG